MKTMNIMYIVTYAINVVSRDFYDNHLKSITHTNNLLRK